MFRLNLVLCLATLHRWLSNFWAARSHMQQCGPGGCPSEPSTAMCIAQPAQPPGNVCCLGSPAPPCHVYSTPTLTPLPAVHIMRAVYLQQAACTAWLPPFPRAQHPQAGPLPAMGAAPSPLYHPAPQESEARGKRMASRAMGTVVVGLEFAGCILTPCRPHMAHRPPAEQPWSKDVFDLPWFSSEPDLFSTRYLNLLKKMF